MRGADKTAMHVIKRTVSRKNVTRKSDSHKTKHATSKEEKKTTDTEGGGKGKGTQ